jgi:hypothetical protein
MKMTDEQRQRLEAKSTVGRTVALKNDGISGERKVGKIVDEVALVVRHHKHLIQKILFADGVSWDSSPHGYRTGYYTYSQGMKKIVWGQYTQFLTGNEYRVLLTKAKAKGWDLFQ